MRKLLMILASCILTATGLLLLKHAHAVTGGTAGLALNLSYFFTVPFSYLFFAINIPFYLFSILRMGWRFTLYTVMSVTLLSILSGIDHYLPAFTLPALPGAIIGGAIIGIGLSLLFMNGASLGGANILALYLQKRMNWNPGTINFIFDCGVVLTSLASIGLAKGAYSVLSIAITSVIISYSKGRIATRVSVPGGSKSYTLQPSAPSYLRP